MRIYLTNITEIDDDDFFRIFSKQTVQRKRKAQSFLRKKDAIRCICAGALIQYCLLKERNINEELEMVYNQYGKPRVKDLDDFFFNISHSEEWVVLASSISEVGIDVQKIINKKFDTISPFFSDVEQEYVLKTSNRTERFRRQSVIWTLKECYLKYLGTGFAYGKSKIFINPRNMQVEFSDRNNGGNPKLQYYTFLRGYILAVCGDKTDVSFEFVDKDRLV